MAILVAYASRHGATKGIAEYIAQTLQGLGRAAKVAPVSAIEHIGAYEAVILGSAVYYGSWLNEAVEFARSNHSALSERPVWLFSSGPLGSEINDEEQQPKEIPELQSLTGARDHRVFFGALDHHALSFPERVLVKAMRAPEGDFRDWNAIAAWATGIAQALETGVETRNAALAD